MPPAFKRVALIGKQTPEIAQSLRALRDFLRQRGCDVMLERETAASVGVDDPLSAIHMEMDTKLDLAIAYQEIGDKEGARELIDEVIKGGSEEQVAKANTMKALLS